mmetsp:Transcript_75844/g.180150  ORF Transcript_75844/g.180150 Transcript_75844/m.180150 type:complete len:1298 (-) Transcript_75844:149-4042(-)
MGGRASSPIFRGELQLGVVGDLEIRLLDGSVSVPVNRREGDGEGHASSSSSGPLDVLSRNARRRRPSVVLPSDLVPCMPTITGDHNLAGKELDAILQLRDARSSLSIGLHKPKGVFRSSVYFMSPVNQSGDHVLPTVVKVKSAEAAVREAKATVDGARHFGHYAMTLLEHIQYEDIGVLQLEISGSRCCVPRFVNAFEATREYGAHYEQAVRESEEDDSQFHRVMRMAHEMFMVILRPCTLRTLSSHTENFMLQCLGAGGSDPKTRVLGSRPQTKFGPNYYDGKVVLSCFGGLLADLSVSGNSDTLHRLVEKACGEREAPSNFFTKFFAAMEACPRSHLCLQSQQGIVHNDLHFSNVMVDADDRVWLIDLETLRSGHIFADLAKGFGCGVFAYAGDIPSDEDEEVLQSLMLLWASIPPNFVEGFLPPPPHSCAGSTTCVWNYTAQMHRYFASFTVEAGANSMAQPHVQLMWSLFVVAVQMVTYKQNAQHPKRKRLALFFSVALAARLHYEMAGGPRPSWLSSFQAKWRKNGTSDNELVTVAGLADAAFERYAVTVRTREAWVRDPFTNQRFDVTKDMMEVKLSQGRVSCFHAGPEDLCELMRQSLQLLVVGSAGSGKTVLTKQVVTHLMNEAKLGSRLPLRIPLMDLKPYVNAGGADLLHTYITHHYHECEARIIATARQKEGLVLILDGLDEGDPQRLWAMQWIKEVRAREDKHWVMLTTRPSALAQENPPARAEYDCLVSWLKRQQMRVRNRALRKGAFRMEDVNQSFVICEIQEFDVDQVRSLARTRLGEDVSKIIAPLLLEDCYRSLVTVPLLATMLMHMLMQALDSKVPMSSQSDVYSFTFTHLLRHVDTSKRRSVSEYDVVARPEAEELLQRLAYNKQVMRERTIQADDFGSNELGRSMWRLAEGGQCALFCAAGDHEVKFFHLTMQEYLAAVYAVKLMEEGAPFPVWLTINNSFAMGVHRFLGELATSNGFPFTEEQAWAFQAPAMRKSSLPRSLMRLLESAFANKDRFAVAGLCELLSVSGVTHVRIDLSGQNLISTKLVARGLAEIRGLEKLRLNFDWCTHLKSCRSLGATWGMLTKLKSLQLMFDGCLVLRSMEELCGGLAHLTKLQSLELSMKNCRRIRDMDELGKSLAAMEELNHLELDFENCLLLSQVDCLWGGIADLTKLTTLKLNLTNCIAVQGVDGLGEALGRLRFLTCLVLRLNGTDMVTDVECICEGISDLRVLRYLVIDKKVREAYFSLSSTHKRRRTARLFILWTSLFVEFLRTSRVVVLLVCHLIWATLLVQIHHS